MDVADNPMGLRVNFLQLERMLSLYHYEKLVLIITITSEKKLSIKTISENGVAFWFELETVGKEK